MKGYYVMIRLSTSEFGGRRIHIVAWEVATMPEALGDMMKIMLSGVLLSGRMGQSNANNRMRQNEV